MARALSFEYLNRQLIWHEMSELLLFLLPLINLPRLKRLLLPYVPRLPSCTQTASRPRMNAVAGTYPLRHQERHQQCCQILSNFQRYSSTADDELAWCLARGLEMW